MASDETSTVVDSNEVRITVIYYEKRKGYNSSSSNVKNFGFLQMPVPKIRHDWYQTETHVVVTILAKNVENAKIIYDKNTVKIFSLIIIKKSISQ